MSPPRGAERGRRATRQMSVDWSRGDDPLAWLSGDRRDAVEVGIVVEHRDPVGLRGRGDEEVGDFAAPLMLGREETLDLPARWTWSALVSMSSKIRSASIRRSHSGCAARRVTDLEIADPARPARRHAGTQFERLPYRVQTNSRQDACIDEVAQRHASSRRSSSARASRSSDRFTVADRALPTRRSDSLTVSLIVSVPSCAGRTEGRVIDIHEMLRHRDRVYTQTPSVYTQPRPRLLGCDGPYGPSLRWAGDSAVPTQIRNVVPGSTWTTNPGQARVSDRLGTPSNTWRPGS